MPISKDSRYQKGANITSKCQLYLVLPLQQAYVPTLNKKVDYIIAIISLHYFGFNDRLLQR